MVNLAIRKGFRISATLFVLIYYFSNKFTTLFIILPFLCIFVAIEILRLCVFRFNERLFNIFKFILKEKERKTLLTTTWFLVSVLLTVVLFRKDIAIMAMLFLIFGDSASAFFGLRFGRTRIVGNRSLEGSLAFFLACLIIGLILNFTKINISWPVVVLGALAATIAELLPLPVDDNFTIPLFSGIIMTIMSKIVS